MDSLKVLVRFRFFVVDHCPSVKPVGKRLVLPYVESSWDDYRGLNNLVPRKDTPSDSVDFVFFDVFVLVS
jgi:hypothetical protein